MKICSDCHITKKLSEFSKNKSQKDTYNNICKSCSKIRYLTIKNLDSFKKNRNLYYLNRKQNNPWIYIWNDINTRCNNSNFIGTKYYKEKNIKNFLTKDQIKELWFRDKAYLLKKPSIDRKNNDGHYTFKNCRFIEMSINSFKNKITKSIIQFDLDGKFIKEWNCIRKARRQLGLNNIHSALNGNYKQTGGFIWRYK